MGANKAVLPEQATITLDRRILPAESIDSVDAEIDRLVSTLHGDYGIEAHWERHETYASASIPVDHPLAAVFREHSAALADARTEPWGIKASTDVRDFINSAGIPAITWGPGSLAQAHTIDEYIDVSAAEAGLTILERAARTLLAESPTST
jgi:succinyl-diaminopimelate desuccinylase